MRSVRTPSLNISKSHSTIGKNYIHICPPFKSLISKGKIPIITLVTIPQFWPELTLRFLQGLWRPVTKIPPPKSTTNTTVLLLGDIKAKRNLSPHKPILPPKLTKKNSLVEKLSVSSLSRDTKYRKTHLLSCNFLVFLLRIIFICCVLREYKILFILCYGLQN